MASNISINDFHSYFVTHVRNIEKEHNDDSGSYPYAVGFNVVCLNNNRVMYFESHLSSNMVPPTPTDQDLVDAAWSNLIPSVKSWAGIVVNSSNIIGTQYYPNTSASNNFNTTSSNFDVSTFTSNFGVSLARFEVYPPSKPNSWCVGFSAYSLSNANENMYVDTNVHVVTFANTLAEAEIMDMAWSNVKDSVGLWAQSKYTQPVLINTTFTSSNW